MNATQTAQSLLSLPSGVSTPDPYAVLGLTPGEADPGKIAAAIKSVVARLNNAKASADPAAWNQAAIWVKESRRIVSDPALKARLDQKIGVASGNPSASRPTAAPPSTTAAPASPPVAKSPLPPTFQVPAAPALDPLSGFLPGQASSSPPAFGQAPPSAAPVGFGDARNTAFRPGNVPSPPGIPQPPSAAPEPAFGQPVGAVAVAGETAPELGTFAKPKSIVRRRRKRFPWASLILVVLTLASIGGIVAIVFYLNKNPGGITIALQPGVDGAVPVAGSNFAVAPPIARDDSPPDPVMGRLSPAKPNRGTDRASTGGAVDDLPSNGPPDDEPPTPSAAAMTDPSMANIPEGSPPPTEVPNMAELPGVKEPTAEQLEIAQAALVNARQVLATAKWGQMNAAAEAAARAAATQEQKQMAQQLVQLAELATYYHIGVEKGLDELKASETFNVTEQLQISVVEITPEKVVLRFNGRNKDYARSELPLVVAHKIAGFSMPIDSPATKAAAQVYQSLAPVTTPQYREQAVKALEAMPPQPDEVDSAVLVAAIRQVFPN